MKRFRVPEIILGVFIGIIISLFGAGVGSYQAEHCQKAQNAQANSPNFNQPVPAPQQSHDGQHQVSEQSKHPPFFACGAAGLVRSLVGFMDAHEGFFVGGFTLALFFATILLWLAGERQMELIGTNNAQQSREMQASIAAAQRSADAAMLAIGSDRAWMTFDNIITNEASDGFVANKPFRSALMIQIQWKNRGRSPALQAAIAISHQIIEYQSEHAPIFEENWGSDLPPNLPVGPGGTVLSAPRVLFDEIRDSVFNEKTAIVVFCVIKYRDTFDSNVEHHSSICMKIRHDGTRPNDKTGQRSPNWTIAVIGSQSTAT